MAAVSTLVWSVLFGIGAALAGQGPNNATIGFIGVGLVVVSWIAIMVSIFSHAKKTGRPTYWTGLGFMLSGLGGIIYFFISLKD